MIYNVRQFFTDCYTILADHPIKFHSVKHLKISFRHIQTSSTYKARDQQCFNTPCWLRKIKVMNASQLRHKNGMSGKMCARALQILDPVYKKPSGFQRSGMKSKILLRTWKTIPLFEQ